MKFNPNRLVFARMLRGKTIAEVATFLGVEQAIVKGYEKGYLSPKKNSDLATFFAQPERFFVQTTNIDFIADNVLSFRAKSTLSEKVKDQAKAYAVLASIFNREMEAMYSLPDVDIPDYSSLTPELAAISLRNYWGLGEHSIVNLIKLLEAKGVRVYSLDIDDSIDANCRWDGEQPYIFLNQKTSAERSRFDAAHELGHLIRDRYLSVISADRENEANRFAAAFLMPEEAIRYYAPSFVTIQRLMEMKKRWGVSLVALAYRMYELGLISEDIYFRVISPTILKLGYRKNEPLEMAKEKSTLFLKMKEKMDQRYISFNEISRNIGFNINDLHSITFGLFRENTEKMMLIKGGGNLERKIISRAHLKLVN